MQVKGGGTLLVTVDARSATTTPRVTVHALGTASRNAGVSRHPNTRIDAELQATATYRFPQQALKSHIPATFSLRPI